MATSMDNVRELLNAESVAGNLIIGERLNRILVGKTDENGIFELTPEGKELVDAKLNPNKPKAKAKKDKEDVVEIDTLS